MAFSLLSFLGQTPFVSSKRCFAGALAAVVVLATGCQARPPHNSPPVSVRSAAFVPSSVVQVQSSVVQVQSSALYQQARDDCKHHDYLSAANRLQTLSQTPGLAPDAIAFCKTQQNIALKDAGLSVAAPTIASLPTLTPADADCGPRALLIVCQKLGVKTTLAQLRQSAGTTAQGTTLAGLQQAAQKLGLQAEGVQVSREALPDTSGMAIAWANRNHYIVLLGYSGSGDRAVARILDPNRTEETISEEHFLQISSGYLLLVHR